jgi:uncharacterized protein YoxC
MNATSAGWVGPTVAISLVAIALSYVVMAVALALLARRTAQEVSKLSGELAQLRGEVSPALSSLRRITDAGADLSGDVKKEVGEYLATSRSLRHDVSLGVRRLKTRLADLDALYEVLHAEVEDTALDVAAKLRTVRKGVGVVSRLRRFLVRSRR